MRLLRSTQELPNGHPAVCLALGFFDGVHLGHQQVIRQTINDAERLEAVSIVVTFDRHPNHVVAPDRVPPLIYSLPQKIKVIGAFGPDFLLLQHFDEGFSRQPAREFIKHLVQDAGPVRSICVGANFLFGYKRSGNVDLLRQFGRQAGFSVHGLSAVSLDRKVVSSTRVRESIRTGDLDAAAQMLGRPYSLAGRVVRGDQLGRKLGFPTANIETTGLVLPPNGVYAAHAAFRHAHCRAVVNIGYRPTLKEPSGPLRVEAHLLDFDGDLYDEELEIIFIRRLRPEQQFASLTDLRMQIREDSEKARSILR